ncbi:unnamed protein product [Closterium sp. Naga37s-1]|nr:unnamed protein product [Closterium sp. Naga37s-1]
MLLPLESTHACQLCDCPPARRTLLYRLSLAELEDLLLAAGDGRTEGPREGRAGSGNGGSESSGEGRSEGGKGSGGEGGVGDGRGKAAVEEVVVKAESSRAAAGGSSSSSSGKQAGEHASGHVGAHRGGHASSSAPRAPITYSRRASAASVSSPPVCGLTSIGIKVLAGGYGGGRDVKEEAKGVGGGAGGGVGGESEGGDSVQGKGSGGGGGEANGAGGVGGSGAAVCDSDTDLAATMPCRDSRACAGVDQSAQPSSGEAGMREGQVEGRVEGGVERRVGVIVKQEGVEGGSGSDGVVESASKGGVGEAVCKEPGGEDRDRGGRGVDGEGGGQGETGQCEAESSGVRRSSRRAAAAAAAAAAEAAAAGAEEGGESVKEEQSSYAAGMGRVGGSEKIRAGKGASDGLGSAEAEMAEWMQGRAAGGSGGGGHGGEMVQAEEFLDRCRAGSGGGWVAQQRRVQGRMMTHGEWAAQWASRGKVALRSPPTVEAAVALVQQAQEFLWAGHEVDAARRVHDRALAALTWAHDVAACCGQTLPAAAAAPPLIACSSSHPLLSLPPSASPAAAGPSHAARGAGSSGSGGGGRRRGLCEVQRLLEAAASDVPCIEPHYKTLKVCARVLSGAVAEGRGPVLYRDALALDQRIRLALHAKPPLEAKELQALHAEAAAGTVDIPAAAKLKDALLAAQHWVEAVQRTVPRGKPPRAAAHVPLPDLPSLAMLHSQAKELQALHAEAAAGTVDIPAAAKLKDALLAAQHWVEAVQRTVPRGKPPRAAAHVPLPDLPSLAMLHSQAKELQALHAEAAAGTVDIPAAAKLKDALLAAQV